MQSKPQSNWRFFRIVGKLISLALKLTLLLLMIGTPLIGVWLASSIAAYSNKNTLFPLLAGLLMFPVLPLLWEAFANWRRKKKGKTGARILNGFDRLVLRTVTLNALLIAGILWWTPNTAFTALSGRGDWMLDGHRGQTAQTIRSALFSTADGLEWLYNSRADNPYRRDDDGKSAKVRPKISEVGNRGFRLPQPGKKNKKSPPKKGPDKQTPPPKEDPNVAVQRGHWPQQPMLHPAIASIPSGAEASIDSVAAYISSKSKNMFARARMAHDYVADRIAYDVPALKTRQMPAH